jgi:hypothetical protein
MKIFKLFLLKRTINLIGEAYKLDIPIISFGNIKRNTSTVSYLIDGSFQKKKFKNFHQFLLYSILKKSKNKMVRRVKQKQKNVLRSNFL